MLKEADLKVYLYAPVEVRARRIHEREGGDYTRVLEETIERDRLDSERYRKLYGIDNDDFGFADLIIDVEKKDQYETTDAIVEAARFT